MNKNLEAYVEHCIEDMGKTLDWAINQMADDSVEYRERFAKKYITEAYNKGLGAIRYQYIWVGTDRLSEPEYEYWDNKLTNAYYLMYDRADEVIK